MKWLMILLLVLSAAVGFTLFSQLDPGYVIIGHGSWRVETSLAVVIIVLLLLLFVIDVLTQLLRGLWQLMRRIAQRQQQHIQNALLQGIFALIQQDWQAAESAFLKAIPYTDNPALPYLGASFATAQLPAPTRMLNYLQQAQHHLPQEQLALTVFQARLQQRYQLPAALKTAQHARSLAPKQAQVLLLLLSLYLQLADWPALLELLPELRKRKVLTAQALQQLENRASIALIQYTLQHNPRQATTLWHNIPKTTRLRPEILTVYVHHLIAAGDAATAEPLLRESLKYHWDNDLIALYGALETAHTSQQLSYAESWLKTRSQDPYLLLTLGQLCLRAQLWGKAQHYLDASLQFKPLTLTYQLLGDLAQQLNEPSQASDYYRRGLMQALEDKN